jgi:hypothetical protein
MVAKNDAILATDSLEIRGVGDQRQTQNSCKILLLSGDSAVAIGGLEKPLQDAVTRLPAKGPQAGKSLRQISTEWFDFAVERLRQAKFHVSEAEYQGGIGGAIFLRAKRAEPIEYIETRIQPIRFTSGQYQQMPERQWEQFSNFKMNSDGLGENALRDWFTGQTALGQLDQKFIRDLDTVPLTPKGLDAAALRIMNGAIDADVRRAQKDTKYQAIIGGPVELLHFDRRTGMMHWVQNPFCEGMPPN